MSRYFLKHSLVNILILYFLKHWLPNILDHSFYGVTPAASQFWLQAAIGLITNTMTALGHQGRTNEVHDLNPVLIKRPCFDGHNALRRATL